MFLVPDFDSIEAYSMSIDESPSLSLNLSPTNLQEYKTLLIFIKRTVSVISSDLRCEDINVRITAV